MRSLWYILLMTMKNYLREMKHHPGRIVLIILLCAMIAINVATSANMPHNLQNYRDMGELYAIIFMFYLITFVVAARAGFDSGVSFYSMADVNFVFTSPISNVSILTYGLMRQASMSLIVGFFLLFQYAWLNSMYGLSINQLVAVLAGYGAVMFSSQLTAMTIYSFCNDNRRRRNVLVLCLSIAGMALFLYAAYKIYIGGMSIEAAVRTANSEVFSFIPVAGWTRVAVRWAIGGDMMYSLVGTFADCAYVVLFIFMVMRMRPDFYEDVLSATEVSANAVAAKKQGETVDVPKHVRKGSTGIGRGWGPTVFFYKHMLEGRRSGIVLLDRTSLMSIAVAAVFAVIMGRKVSITYIFAIAAYMQLLSAMSAGGRWTKELRMPYVFLAPSKPFVKLLMIIWDNIFRLIIESIAMFAIIGLVTGGDIFQMLSCIAARIALGVLFMAGNILIVRTLGSTGGQVMPRIAFLGAMTIALMLVVSIAMIAAPFIKVGDHTVAVMAGMTLSGLSVAVIIIACCRNMLDCAELVNK